MSGAATARGASSGHPCAVGCDSTSLSRPTRPRASLWRFSGPWRRFARDPGSRMPTRRLRVSARACGNSPSKGSSRRLSYRSSLAFGRPIWGVPREANTLRTYSPQFRLPRSSASILPSSLTKSSLPLPRRAYKAGCWHRLRPLPQGLTNLETGWPARAYPAYVLRFM